MQLLDIIARFFLSFSHETVLLPLSLIGYNLYSKRKWGGALYILLFTMILAKFLKNIWQIPLPDHFEASHYAFPSGHMQAASAFYGWIMLECRNKKVILICLSILIGVAFGLVHFDYHIMRDIWGAIGFAFATIIIYKLFLDRFFINHPERIGIILTIMGLVFVYYLQPMNFVWLPVGGIVGFTIGWNVAGSDDILQKPMHRIGSIIITIARIALIKFGAGFIYKPSAFEIFTTYALTGLWIGITPWVVNKIKMSRIA